MKILLLSSMLPTPQKPDHGGGSATVAEAVWKAMIRRGHEVVALRAASAHGPPERVDGSMVYDAAQPNLYAWREGQAHDPVSKAIWHLIEDNGGPARSAVEVLDAFAPDVVASHNPMGLGTGLWAQAARRGVPVVHTLHDYYLLCPRTTRNRGGADCQVTCTSCRWLTRTRRARAGLLSGVVSVSRHVLAVHESAGVFSEACDRRVIHNAAAVPAAVEHAYDGSGPFRIGFIGRGSRYKGLDVLLDAFDGLKAANATLTIAGVIDPEILPRLATLKHPDRVIQLGFCAPSVFYGQVDVVVVPSIGEEAFSLVVGEAKARGLPVIASDIGGIPEALGGPEAGWLVPPRDARALARLLDEVSGQPALLRDKGMAGRSDAARWAMTDFEDAYEAAYRDAVVRARL